MEEQFDRTMAQACVGTSLNSIDGSGTSKIIGIHLHNCFNSYHIVGCHVFFLGIILFQLPISIHDKEFARNAQRWQNRKSSYQDLMMFWCCRLRLTRLYGTHRQYPQPLKPHQQHVRGSFQSLAPTQHDGARLCQLQKIHFKCPGKLEKK